MRKSVQIRQAIGIATDALASLIDDGAAFSAKEIEIRALEESLARALTVESRSASLAQPAAAAASADLVPTGSGSFSSMAAIRALGNTNRIERRNWEFTDYLPTVRSATGFVPNAESHFRSFGEYLVAVVRHANGDGTDNRLVRAPNGAGETDGSGGGFLVQTDFASTIWTRAYDMGDILGEVFRLPISNGSNGIKIPAIDESSRATGSRWGGVSSYWVGEGDTGTSGKPKFRIVELDLKKLLSTMVVSDELLEDAAALQTIAFQAFSEEIMFMTEDAIWEGDGVGKPLGIMNSPALVTVAKDSGQAAATLTLSNILNMWSRCWSRSRRNAAWYISQDIEPQLYALSQAVGTGGLPMYLPAGGLNAAPYSTLFGRPVIPVEYASTLGTPGDIVLADFSQYVLADKRGMQAATSMHVRFLTDEMVFRFIYRVDGSPLWHTPLTPFKGSNTRSPFISLAQR